MKKIVLSVAVLAIAFTACKKDEKTTTPITTNVIIDTTATTGDTAAVGTIIGTFDGSKKVFDTLVVTQNQYGLVQITGSTKDFSHTIALRMYVSPKVGVTYNIGQDGNNQGILEVGSGTGKVKFVTNTTNTGTVKITKYDTVNKLISGTFSFKAKLEDPGTELKEVTFGSFTDVKIL